MDRFVSLERLPERLQFPPAFTDRIRYDDASRRLIHSGFMSKAEFDVLWGLHPDWGYRRALEDLFRLCTPESASSGEGSKFGRTLKRFAAVVTGVGLTGAALMFWLNHS